MRCDGQLKFVTMNEKEIETLKERVIAVLKTIYDPEIPIDIWTLHLIYGVDVDAEGNVAETLPAEVKQKVQAIMGVKNTEVELTFEPVWSIDMLSDEAKAELGLDGEYGDFSASDFLY